MMGTEVKKAKIIYECNKQVFRESDELFSKPTISSFLQNMIVYFVDQ